MWQKMPTWRKQWGRGAERNVPDELQREEV
jgi:hypothetical protein